MSNKKKTVVLAYGLDKNYLTPFFVNLTSVFLNNSDVNIKIYAIATGLKDSEREALVAYAERFNATIVFCKADFKDSKKLVIRKEDYYPVSTYYRLFLPHAIPRNLEKAIYLDVDTIVTGKLFELYDLELYEFPLAVAPDHKIIRPDLEIIEEGLYFNAGVILFNLSQWISQGVTKRAIEFAAENPQKILFADQDALNAVLINNFLKIDKKYNLTFRDIPESLHSRDKNFLHDKIVIHFNDRYKPWSINSTHRLKYLYNHYADAFFKSHVGKSLITKNAELHLDFLLVRLSKDVSMNMEKTLLLAFCLHIGWIKAVSDVLHPKKIIKILYQYYSSNSSRFPMQENINYISEFQNNKTYLLQIFRSIMSSDRSQISDELRYIVGWENVCKVTIAEKLEGTSILAMTEMVSSIPEIINKKMEVVGTLKDLLYLFNEKVLELELIGSVGAPIL